MGDYKIVATLTIHTSSYNPDKEHGVAYRRKEELKEWLNRHIPDIVASVCSQWDELEKPVVTIEEE